MPTAQPVLLPEPLFAEPSFNESSPTPDPTYFEVRHPSDNPLYDELKRRHLLKGRGFKKSRLPDDALFPFANALGTLGPRKVQQIRDAGKIVFHAMGDTGSTKGTATQNLVADMLVADCHAPVPGDRPAFFYHLGDIVYSFGEAKYYYDQFYEPYRNYTAPIFAVPGNHDGMISPAAPPEATSLETFYRNFCAETPGISPDAVSLHRTAMTQPGVYFTLDAPFVRIIGLYSNALEDPGVISSETGLLPHHGYPDVPDYQLEFLRRQLQRIKDEHYAGCVLLAVHHPPFSWTPPHPDGGTGNHGGSPRMLAQIDAICEAVGVYPHAFLSGHAHNYQRYTRAKTFHGQPYEIPFIVCGSGGHAVNPLVRGRTPRPDFGARADHMGPGLVLAKYNDLHYGYLQLTVDARTLRIAFLDAESPSLHQARYDLVSVDLATHRLVAN